MKKLAGRGVVLRGRGIIGGIAAGEALVSTQAFMFPHGIDPKNGVIVDKRHELYGQSIAGKVFVFPFGKGSTSAATWILETVRNNAGPAAIINESTEPIIATGMILAEIFYDKKIPVVDNLERNPLKIIKTGDYVKVDGNKGIVEVVAKAFRERD